MVVQSHDRYQGSLWDIVGEEGANIPDRRAVAADLVKQLLGECAMVH